MKKEDVEKPYDIWGILNSSLDLENISNNDDLAQCTPTRVLIQRGTNSFSNWHSMINPRVRQKPPPIVSNPYLKSVNVKRPTKSSAYGIVHLKHENTVDDFDEVSYFDDDINDTNQPINFDIFESGDTFESSISYFTDEVLRREIVENEFISNNEITSQIKLNENKKWNVSFLNREQKSYRVTESLEYTCSQEKVLH